MKFLNLTRFAIALTLVPSAVLAQADAAPAIPAAVSAPAVAAPANNTPVTRAELPALVKEAIMSNPEMIMEAVEKLREKQRVEAEQKTQAAVAANKANLYNDPDTASVGDEKTANITLVEFFDYHCGYCKHMIPTLTQLINDDKKVRVVFKEYPILSEDSALAARAAIAVNRLAKDKYFAYHSALMKHEGKFEEKNLLDIATKTGIDAKKLKAEMEKPEVAAILDKSRKLGEELGVRGTPAIIMNDHFLPGAVELDALKKMIENVRAGRKPSEDAPVAPVAAPAAEAPAAAPAAAPAPATN